MLSARNLRIILKTWIGVQTYTNISGSTQPAELFVEVIVNCDGLAADH